MIAGTTLAVVVVRGDERAIWQTNDAGAAKISTRKFRLILNDTFKHVFFLKNNVKASKVGWLHQLNLPISPLSHASKRLERFTRAEYQDDKN